jgi:transposase InsO family protein
MRVSRNSYYHWVKNKDLKVVGTPRSVLKKRIRVIFRDSKEIYGSCRIQKMLEREHLYYSRSYIGILMREMGLRSVLKRKFVATTDSKHILPIADNALGRNFSSAGLSKKWVSDITYIRVGDNWCYLTTVMDLADRKIVGWALSEDMTTKNTVQQAWINACRTRLSNQVLSSIPIEGHSTHRTQWPLFFLLIQKSHGPWAGKVIVGTMQ